MTNISIFEVNLGEDIDSIVRDNIAEITKRTRENIDAAIEQSKKVEIVKVNKARQLAAINTAIINAYEELLKGRTLGIAVSSKKLLSISEPGITSINSLIPRLKTYLKNRGNEYRIVTVKRNGETSYQLEPFNVPD